MKRFSFEPVKEWFGYTRRERRASFILLILIVAVTAARYVTPPGDILVEEIPLQVNEGIKTNSPVRVSTGTFSRDRGGTGAGRQKPLLDINRCDSSALEALPGIGPVLAARIIKFRNLLGGFVSVEQLKEVYGLPEETYNIVSVRVFADTAAVRKINVNTADFRQLVRIPYLEKYEVTAILKYRELEGKIDNIAELVDNKLIAPGKAGRMEGYLEY